ncbi:MAG: Mn transporter [Deltaproteobacteria bacterium RIFOXYD12_FULL_50_9]|nr:MAG: Mn transporter [Deltaproteobacteria bacterium RIFOXYD12_FULL_50_9]
MAETKKSFRLRFLLFLSIMGPGIITANVDNDAGGIATYSQAGALYGFDVLWIFIPMTVVLVLVQEMANRMGVVTGDGLSSLIRERFGVKITFYLMLALLVTNFGNIMAEFAGIASAAELFGIPRIIAVPICAFLVWYMVLRWSYRSVEKIFLLGCFFYVAYLLSAFMAKPDMGEIAIALVTPKLIATKDYMFMLIGIVGTTIAPWMQFYQQASIVEKGIDIEDYSYSRSDTILGGITVSIVAMCIVVVCAMTLHRSGISIEDASQAAQALAPLAGLQASKLFAFGLWNASMFAACILPLSTAYSICEALGWERGVDQRYEDAKQFYVLYTTSIILGALIVLIPGLSLMNVMLISQIVNGFLFTVILVFMLILVNDEKLMGKYTNSRFYNAVCFATVVVLALISVVSLFSLVL